MVAYSMQFHECDGTVTDMLVEAEFDAFADAHEYAVRQAREIMAQEVREGRLCLSCWIVIRDATGHVATLQFGEAISLVRDTTCRHETEADARLSIAASRFSPADQADGESALPVARTA